MCICCSLSHELWCNSRFLLVGLNMVGVQKSTNWNLRLAFSTSYHLYVDRNLVRAEKQYWLFSWHVDSLCGEEACVTVTSKANLCKWPSACHHHKDKQHLPHHCISTPSHKQALNTRSTKLKQFILMFSDHILNLTTNVWRRMAFNVSNCPLLDSNNLTREQQNSTNNDQQM